MAQKPMLTRALQEHLLGQVSFSAVTGLLAAGADPSAGFDRRMQRRLSEAGLSFSLDCFEVQKANGEVVKETVQIRATPQNFIGALLSHPDRSARQATLSAWFTMESKAIVPYKDGKPVLSVSIDDIRKTHPLFADEHRGGGGEALALDWHTVALFTRNRASTACLFSAMAHDSKAAKRVGERCMTNLERSLRHKRAYDDAPWAMEVGAGRYAHPHNNDAVDTLRALAWGASIPLSFWQKEVEMKFLMPGYAEHRVTPISHAFSIGGNQCGIHHAAAHGWHANGVVQAATALRESGLNIYDTVEKTNKSMLHMAAESGGPSLVAGLLQLGFDPSQKDSRGYTALSYAKMSTSPDQNEVMALLQASSAQSLIARIAAQARPGLSVSP